MARITARVSIAKAKVRSFGEGLVYKCSKSYGPYQKPVDLCLGRVKSLERGMEARYRF